MQLPGTASHAQHRFPVQVTVVTGPAGGQVHYRYDPIGGLARVCAVAGCASGTRYYAVETPGYVIRCATP
ncbi:MAG: hypothetical protein HYV02_07325 [Deltaproteobacteria bacterium]|nr:hypothetical protein [Deltaproteobacteria bacterium]